MECVMLKGQRGKKQKPNPVNLQGKGRHGETIILISHDMGVVAEYASRIIVMKDGGILMDAGTRGCFPGLIFFWRRPLSRICWPGRVMM